MEISPKTVVPVNTRVEVADIAGVSDNTIAKVKKIEALATPEQKERLSMGDASINEIHTQVKHAEKSEGKAVARVGVRLPPSAL